MTEGIPTLSQFIIACDVGNSRVKYGLFRRRDLTAGPAKHLPPCIATQVVDRGDSVDWSPFRARCAAEDSSASVEGIIAGSDPEGVNAANDCWRRDWASKPHIIDRSAALPVEVRVAEPSKVGIDRLLNVIAANVLRPEKSPSIIVDSGTATTVDAVSADGAFCGGAILPGFEMSARGLHQYTALLPLIEIDELSNSVPAPLGRDTRCALHSGLYWGQLGAVRELIERISHDDSISGGPKPNVLLTGGGAVLLKSQIADAQWEPHLSLQGLACAYSVSRLE